MAVEVRRLDPRDDRTRFRSGNVELDRFFLRYAGQNQFRHHIGTTYVAVREDGFVAGFATVTMSEVAVARASAIRRKSWPHYPLPVLRLARLAVDERAKGQGIGSLLLRAVFVLAQRLARGVGCAGVVVDAKPEAVAFYEKLGFIPLDVAAGQLGDRPEPQPMFMEVARIPEPAEGRKA